MTGLEFTHKFSTCNSVMKTQDFQHEMPLAGTPLHSGGPQKLYQLAGVGVHHLRALAPVVLLWTPSFILSRMPSPYYRKRGSASYIVREVRSVRERYTERERERESETEVTSPKVALKLAISFARSLPKMCTFSIGKEICTFPCQKIAPLSPLWNDAEFTLCVAKSVALFETLRIPSFCFCQMASQGIGAPKQKIEFPAAPFFFSSKK